MKKKTKATTPADQEPIGIVISRGAEPEEAPTVFAYVWGPAPEVSESSARGKSPKTKVA